MNNTIILSLLAFFVMAGSRRRSGSQLTQSIVLAGTTTDGIRLLDWVLPYTPDPDGWVVQRLSGDTLAWIPMTAITGDLRHKNVMAWAPGIYRVLGVDADSTLLYESNPVESLP